MDVGARLGRYRILGRLGSIASAEVHRGLDTVLRREITVLVPDGAQQEEETLRERFESEMRAASSVSHPNIAAVHDVGRSEGVSYAVLELLEGETLEDRLSRGALSLQETNAIAAAVAKGLAAAHRAGVVHHRIRPGAIFLTKAGEAKVFGFGSPTPNDVEATGGGPGVDPYLSPEQLSEEPVDTRSDVYALGCVLIEMLTGARPGGEWRTQGAGSSNDRTMETRLLDYGVSAPEVMENVLAGCLEKRPERRWDANAVALALEGIADEDGVDRTSTLSEVVPVGRRRHRWMVAVAAAGLVLAYSATQLLMGGGSHGDGDTSRSRSLAVLPLAGFPDDEEHFADGMTEALIAHLARVEALGVISRTSVMRYKDAQRSIPQIARELGVELVVEGSVTRSETRVRIIIQLIDPTSDAHLWGQSFQGEASDILNLQSEVAEAVRREVERATSTSGRSPAYRARRVEPQAHDAYLKGRYLLNLDSVESMREALDYFHEAILRDPRHALAHVGLAETLIRLCRYGAVPSTEAYDRARVSAVRALELEPGLAEAHVVMGEIACKFDWDWETAERQYLRAIEFGPGLARAHERYAILLTARGRIDGAVRHGRRALELDPMSARLRYALAAIHYCAGDLESAKEHARQALVIAPDFGAAEGTLGLCFEQEGRFEEASAQFKRAGALVGTLGVAPELGHAYARAGRLDEALALVAEVESMPDVDPGIAAFTRAMTHLGAGDHDAAVDSLEELVELRFGWVMLLRADPRFGPLQGDSRFQALVAEAGLSGPDPSL